MASAIRFFYKNAGYSYDPKTETKNQGRWRCARKLAFAEEFARAHDWKFIWENDWSVGDHSKEFDCYEDGGPESCEQCFLRDTNTNEILASLSCIDDADANYRRVIEAELALEAMHAAQCADEARECALMENCSG